MFRIKMLPAARGDALLITYGDPAAPHSVLIDGGPDHKEGTPERQAWKAQVLALGNNPLELLVITHIDADHIDGAVRLLQQANLPRIGDVWFNGWDHLGSDKLGAKDGEVLTTVLEERAIPWNTRFGGKAVARHPGAPLPTVTLPGDLQITLLSPDMASLNALQATWEKEVKAAGLIPGQPVPHEKWPSDVLGEEELDVEAEAAKKPTADSSKANGSSIAFLAEYKGKAALFGADCPSKALETGIRALLQQRGQSILKLDAFKVPHHGSRNNTTPGLLRLLDSRRYLISSDGSIFKHPDREALARIALRCAAQSGEPTLRRPDEGLPALCFNYLSDYTRPWIDPDLQELYHYRAVYPAEGQAGLSVDL